MNLLKILFFMFFLLLFSCADNDETKVINESYPAGVVLTFDDDFVDNWINAHEVLKKYDWRATFCVTRFAHLNQNKIDKLKVLQLYGHEIAGHGVNHLNAISFVETNGINAYFNEEINPMLGLMNVNNFQVSSFAYPYGARNSSIDNTLFNTFKILRGTTYGGVAPKNQICYYNASRLVYGLGIDNNYAHFNVSYFLSLLDYAKKNNKIVIFYAHKPVEKVKESYETEMKTIISICEYAKNNNLKFYKLSELYGL